MRCGSLYVVPSGSVLQSLRVVALLLLATPSYVTAQQAGSDYCSSNPDSFGGLCSSTVFEQFNPFEQAAASANQATFDRLDPVCGVASNQPCTGAILSVYEAVREFVHTANALSGDPFLPTEFSLELDQEGLGFALRWSAAEEMAAQGSVTSRFAANQLTVLASRVADLRWGAGGLRVASLGPNRGERVLYASADSPAGTGQGGDQWAPSRWGGFVDGAFGWGDREDSTFSGGFENAFDFDGKELNIGIDYRFTNSVVAGFVFGYSDSEVDFNSSLSIVDADIETSGYSGQAFTLLEGEHAYMSASLGYQRMDHDVRRRIVYPSNNANIASTDSTALSSTDSSTFLASLGAGYQSRWGALTAEPYVDLQYRDSTVDRFVERSFSNLPGEESSPDAFALVIGRQTIDSFDSSAGLRLRYVMTPRFGVLIPYLHSAYHREWKDDARVISGFYAGASSELASAPGADFSLSTDEPDDDYWTAIAGFSVVLPNGLQGFVQYLRVFDLDYYTQSVISGGLRYEF